MTEERLVCIRIKNLVNPNEVAYKRLPLVEAKKLVENGNWVFTSKAKYRRYMKEVYNNIESELIKEDQSGIIIPAYKKEYPNDAKKDLIKPNKNGEIATEYNIHKAKKHLVSVDPKTGAKVYAKEGRHSIVKTIYNILKIKK